MCTKVCVYHIISYHIISYVCFANDHLIACSYAHHVQYNSGMNYIGNDVFTVQAFDGLWAETIGMHYCC
jgi:hypothetical protein